MNLDKLAPRAPIRPDQWAGLFGSIVDDRDGFEFAVRIVGGLSDPYIRVVLRHAGNERSREVGLDELNDGLCELLASIRVTKPKGVPTPTRATPSLEKPPRKPSLISQIVEVMRGLPKQMARAHDVAEVLKLDTRDVAMVLGTYSRRGKYVKVVVRSQPRLKHRRYQRGFVQTIYQLIEEGGLST